MSSETGIQFGRMKQGRVLGSVAAALTASSLALVACSAPSEPVSRSAVESPTTNIPSALDDPTAAGLPEPIVDPNRIISGGPPPDGIPPIDEPNFDKAADVDWLEDNEPVIVVDHHGEVKGYPVQIMTWHEIVNDEVGGEPVAVTYCPLCNSAIAFPRTIDGATVSFGTSGSLYLSALVMYDRETESLWSQVQRQAIAGHYTGTELPPLSASTVTWQDFRAAHPEAPVLNRDTGHERRYGDNPYPSYDTSDFNLLDEAVDGRLPAKTRVVTLLESDEVVLLDDLARVKVASVDSKQGPTVLLSAPGLASALSDQAIAEGTPIPATGSFSRKVDGQTLTFQPGTKSGSAVDKETGTTWNILGEAVAGPLKGKKLEAVPHVDTFWFAIKAFKPDLTVIEVSPD